MTDPLLDVLTNREAQKQEDPAKREWAVYTKPDKTTGKLWGDAHFAPLPEGELLDVVHNHPGGTSLSRGDLELLSRVGRIEAQGQKRYSAKRGPAYDTLKNVYDEVAGKIASELAHKRRIRGYHTGPTQEELINQELARRGIIEYLEEQFKK